MLSVKNIVDPLSPMSRDALATATSFIPLKSLRHGFLEELFLYVQPQSIVAGQTIFSEGSYDQQVIYLSTGRILLTFASGRSLEVLASENVLPLANEQPRPAEAVALEDSTILRMDSDRLDRTLSWSQITDYVLSELANDRSNDGNLEWMQTVLSSNLFFKVPAINAEKILSKLHLIAVKEGEIIIQEGATGDCCYFLKQGSASILKEQGSESVLVAEITEGRCFGEDALLERKPRNASVVMNSDGVLLRLDKPDFLTLLQEPTVEEIDLLEFDTRDDNPILIDIRTDSEYRLGHLAFSANIPMSVLSVKQRLLSLEQPYVLYCDTGRRSRAAAYFLGKKGFNVVSLGGGMQKQKLLDRIVTQPSYMLRNGQLELSDD